VVRQKSIFDQSIGRTKEQKTRFNV